MTTYRQAFNAWRRAWLENELAKAGGNVSQMSRNTGLNRQHIYKLCEKAGVAVATRPSNNPTGRNSSCPLFEVGA